MGNYEVPVPEHWLIFDHNYVAFTLINASPTVRRDGKLHMAAVVDIFPFRKRAIGAERLAFWLSLHRQWLEREGVKSVEERELNIGGASAHCIGGTELRDAVIRGKDLGVDTDIVSLDCQSTDGLEVLFVGEPSDVQPFYTLVSQIRKHE